MSPPPPPHHPHHPPPPQQQPQPHHPPPQQPQQPPPQHQYYPYPYPHPPPKPKSKNLASCILATSFLTIILVAGVIACYILFHPQDPSISISTIKFTSYTLNTNSTNTTTANFTFLQYNSVRNPNRYAFSHHGSSFQLISTSSGPLGFIYIPAGMIDGGRTRFVTANFDVKSVPVGPGPTLEVETLMNLVGGVKVFNVFAHHVQKSVRCRVSVKVTDGSLLGYHC